jgi:hypothetical protein
MEILEEKRVGVPAKNWYRLDLDVLGRTVAEFTGRTFEHWNWDRSAMLHLLGQPIPCHRILIKVADGVVGGLILSYLFRTTRSDLSNGGDGEWLHIPVCHTRELLGITIKQQRTAREHLRDLNLVEEMFEKAVQPVLLTRLNMGLLGLECARKANEIHCLQDSRNHVCEILQTRVADNAYLELPKAQIKDCRKRISGVAESADQELRIGQVSIKKENYKEQPLQEPASAMPASPPNPAGCSGSGVVEIVLPEKLHTGEAMAARNWLKPLDAVLQQQVADEWAGLLSLDARGIRPVHNRLGLLMKLIRRARGLEPEPFTPTLAFEVAAARMRRQEIEAARQKHQQLPAAEVRTTREAARQAMAVIAQMGLGKGS